MPNLMVTMLLALGFVEMGSNFEAENRNVQLILAVRDSIRGFEWLLERFEW